MSSVASKAETASPLALGVRSHGLESGPLSLPVCRAANFEEGSGEPMIAPSDQKMKGMDVATQIDCVWFQKGRQELYKLSVNTTEQKSE